MKKKIIALSACAVLAATAVAGASLAYFTDTDQEANVFAVGSVEIRLNEQQRNEDGELEEFQNGKILMPSLGAESNERDDFGLPTEEGFKDKIVTVTNTGKSPAYVRVTVAIPASLENIGETEANALHYTDGAGFLPNEEGVNPDWVNWSAPAAGTTLVEEMEYNTYTYTYLLPLAPEATTPSPCITGVYLDAGVDLGPDNVYTLDGEFFTYNLQEGIKIPVFAQAVQAEGFETAAAAFAASGLPSDPWTK